MSAQVRIFGWAVLLLAVAGAAALLLQRQVLLERLDERIDDDIDHEIAELRQLSAGRDPATGEPFGDDAAAIVDAFLRGNVPAEGETFLALVGNDPPKATAAPYALWEDDALMDRWRGLTQGERGELSTPQGPARYMAVPLVAGDEPRGVVAVVNFLQAQRDEIEDRTRISAVVYGSVGLATVALAWVAAGRVLAPVRVITDTARELSESDLRRRIPVPDSDDEIARLARTFNAMLDRLAAAFANQRQFLDDAGHELRTPITIIRGHLELETDDPDERRATRAVILDELDRMARIVDDLLVLARAEQPDFLRVEPVDLDVLTTEVFGKARALGDRDWRLVAVGHGIVEADRQRMTQAVMNLADNAVRHTGPGSTIEVGSALEGDEARLWVRDWGPGIPPEDQERIFQRFSRAQDGARRAGTAGLGLAIVRAIALAHGGRVAVDSTPGAGATFTIALPVEPFDGGDLDDDVHELHPKGPPP